MTADGGDDEQTGAGDRRLVVLDIDDTLYLERDYVRSGFAAVGTWARDRARRRRPGRPGLGGVRGRRAPHHLRRGARRLRASRSPPTWCPGWSRSTGRTAPPSRCCPTPGPWLDAPGPPRDRGRGDRRAARQPAGQGRGPGAHPLGRPGGVHRVAGAGPGQAAPGRVRAPRARARPARRAVRLRGRQPGQGLRRPARASAGARCGCGGPAACTPRCRAATTSTWRSPRWPTSTPPSGWHAAGEQPAAAAHRRPGAGRATPRRPQGGPPDDRRLQPALPAVPAAHRRARPGRRHRRHQRPRSLRRRAGRRGHPPRAAQRRRPAA